MYLFIYGCWSLLGLMWILYRYEIYWLWTLIIPIGAYLSLGILAYIIPYLIDGVSYHSSSLKKFSEWIKNKLDFPENLEETLRQEHDLLITRIFNYRKMSVLLITFLSIFSVMPALRMYFILIAFDIDFSFFILFFGLSAFYSVTILPISMGGLGVVEGTAIGALVLMGMDQPTAIAAVFLDRIFAAYIPAILGMSIFLIEDFDYDLFKQGRK